MKLVRERVVTWIRRGPAGMDLPSHGFSHEDLWREHILDLLEVELREGAGRSLEADMKNLEFKISFQRSRAADREMGPGLRWAYSRVHPWRTHLMSLIRFDIERVR